MTKEIKLRIQILELQKARLIARWKRQKLRDAFIKKHLKKILSLSTSGWPRTKNMKDYPKWIDLVFEAKIKGVYGMGTSNCDVIANLERFAKQINNLK